MNGSCIDIDECMSNNNVKVPADGICSPSSSGAAFETATAFCKGKGGGIIVPSSQADFDYVQVNYCRFHGIDTI